MNAMAGRPLADALDFLGLPASAQANVDESEIAAIVEARLAFIREKNWAEADRIRDELLGQGIQLKDGKDKDTGERVTTWEVKR